VLRDSLLDFDFHVVTCLMTGVSIGESGGVMVFGLRSDGFCRL
jgi:hypothetical protein